MEQERKPLFDTIDWLIGIGAVPFQSAPIFVAAALIVLVRHWPWLAGGFLGVLGVRQVTPFWCKVLPGAVSLLDNGIMSNEPQNHPGAPGSGTGSDEVVLSQQHQAEPAPVLEFEAVIKFLSEHNLSDEQAIDLFTVSKRQSGYFLSANKIRETVGGNEATVKARVASRRPKPPEPLRTMGRAVRPENGW